MCPLCPQYQAPDKRTNSFPSPAPIQTRVRSTPGCMGWTLKLPMQVRNLARGDTVCSTQGKGAVGVRLGVGGGGGTGVGGGVTCVCVCRVEEG